MSFHYKCTVSYDGKSYNGFQRQHNTSNTIQETIEHILSNYLNAPIVIRASGRTDQGVNAFGQVFDFFYNKKIDISIFVSEINLLLPDDIRILYIEETDANFHSRKSAVSKIYEYHICTRDVPVVFNRRYSYHIPANELDIDAMKKCADILCGYHDFSSFTSDKRDIDCRRNIYSIEFNISKDSIIIAFHGSGFLYNMVRILTGTLVEVGMGKRSLDTVRAALNKRDRALAGFTAPSNALFLAKVIYED